MCGTFWQILGRPWRPRKTIYEITTRGTIACYIVKNKAGGSEIVFGGFLEANSLVGST